MSNAHVICSHRIRGCISPRAAGVLAAWLLMGALSAPADVASITADRDAVVSSAAHALNFGTIQYLYVGWDENSGVLPGYSSAAKLMRCYIHFDVTNDLPAGCVPENITSARIRIRKTGTNNAGEPPYTITIKAARVTGSWTEGGITYDNMPGTSDQLGSFDWTDESFINIDIDPSVVVDWYYNPSSNRGVQIAAQWAEINHYWIRFASRESTGFPAPELELTYDAPDTTPPVPNPPDWSLEPYPLTSTSIRMSAYNCTDTQSPPVQYYFDFMQGSGGHDSGWIANPVYDDTGLTPNTSYGYRAKARDSASPPNETSANNSRSCYTYAAVPPAPTVGNPTATTLDVTPAWGTNPVATELAIRDVTRGCWVQGDGSCTAQEYWNDYHWGTVTVTGLTPGQPYEFQVKARNHDDIETVLGPGASGTTASNPPYVTLTLDSVNPDNSFRPGDQVVIVLRATNSGGPVDGVVTLNVFDARFTWPATDPSKVYDSHALGEDQPVALPSDGFDLAAFSFTLPLDAPPGPYRILAAVREAPWGDVLDTTGPEPATADWSDAAHLVGFTVEPDLTYRTKGITVLVHGFRPCGDNSWCIFDEGFTPVDYWGEARIVALLTAYGGGRVYNYEPASGTFTWDTRPAFLAHDEAAGEIILVHNWGEASNDSAAGQAEAAAEALVAGLVQAGYVNPATPSQSMRMHLIAHSRGASVASEVVQRLGVLGIPVHYLTYLDPHDFDEQYVPFDEGFHDPAVQIWSNVLYADVFWQRASLNYVPSGRPLDDLYDGYQHDYELTELPGFGSDYTWRPHGRVIDWYFGTVTPGTEQNQWYDDPVYFERNGYTTGFSNWVLLGGYDFANPNGEGLNSPVADPLTLDRLHPFHYVPTDDDDDNDAAWNFTTGDFDLPGLGSAIAGWSYHGGGGTGHLNNGRLELDSGGDDSWRRHNRFYVPQAADSITFEYWVTVRTDTHNELVVYLGPEDAGNIIGAVNLDYIHYGTLPCTIPLDKRGTVQTLTFKIAYGTSVSAEVQIDNIAIVNESNHVPDAPLPTAPPNGSTGVARTPTLQCVAFSDPDPGDLHAASWWQVDDDAAFGSPAWDSGEVTASTQAVVPDGALAFGCTYSWRAKYKDDAGAWSDWSTVWSFTTLSPPLPTVTVQATDASAAEGGDTGAYRITRDGDTSAALSVYYALSGTAGADDFNLNKPSPATIPIGAAYVDVVLTPVDDPDDEPAETAVLTLTANATYQVGTPDNATITIQDNDLPLVMVSALDATAQEGGSTGSYRIRRVGDTAAGLTVYFTMGGTTAPEDYSLDDSSPVTIPADWTYTDIVLTPVDDAEYESDETAVLTLSSNAAYDVGVPSATVTIQDNDAAPCRGDTNCDGQIDFYDINPFVDALLYSTYCDGNGANADVNGNGVADFYDINPFIDLLMQELPILCE